MLTLTQTHIPGSEATARGSDTRIQDSPRLPELLLLPEVPGRHCPRQGCVLSVLGSSTGSWGDLKEEERKDSAIHFKGNNWCWGLLAVPRNPAHLWNCGCCWPSQQGGGNKEESGEKKTFCPGVCARQEIPQISRDSQLSWPLQPVSREIRLESFLHCPPYPPWLWGSCHARAT